MRNLRILAALGMISAAAAANAGVTSTWTLASDYDFRGITQTANDPAIQASIDYAHDSGWYVGGWASNVKFCPSPKNGCAEPNAELDLYTGFSGSTGEGGLGWDVGLIYYTYPGESDYNYFEAYGSLSKDWFKGKVWYSNDFGGDVTQGNTPAFYVEGNGTFPLPNNFSVLAHVGYSFGDYWDDTDKYFDYSLGVGYTVGNFSLALKWIDGSDYEFGKNTPDDVFSSEGRVVFTVATTFPWK
jgi:uncharacterized protein (TIGR02001 family)